MDIRPVEARPTDAERSAIDALLGPPQSAWDGGARGTAQDAHVAVVGGRESRARRHLLLPSLLALQSRVGWISEGGLGYVCTRLNVPPADAWGVATFYALLATSPRPPRVVHVCDDIACKCRGADDLIRTLEQTVGPAHGHAPHGLQVSVGEDGATWTKTPCLGLCDRAPAAFVTQAGVQPGERQLGPVSAEQVQQILRGSEHARPEGRAYVLPDVVRPDPGTPDACRPDLQVGRAPHHPSDRRAHGRRLLRRVGRVDPSSLDAYRGASGYSALAKALAMGPEAVIAEVTASRLMGRGGAAFPTGRKWEAVAKQPATPHYLICNADESEPGTFKDRVLMEEDPFAIVEAMTIAAFATGCRHGYIYIRGEYPRAFHRLEHAIAEARRAQLLGDDILGRGLVFDIEIRRGAGAYICGEETALFESIEGRRGEPRNKPPFPVQAGLFGKPTLVNNVETLANVPLIILEGAAAFTAIGTSQSTGTRLFCLSGHVQRPGVYEAACGTTVRGLIEMAGGLAPGRSLSAVLLGGAAGTFLCPDEIDLRLTHEDTRVAGATMGSGVVLVMDDTADLHDIVRRIAAFFRDESCGQCVPCRVGTVRQEEALHRIARGVPRGGLTTELALLDDVGLAMKDASICGLGQTAYSVVESAIKRLRLYDAQADS